MYVDSHAIPDHDLPEAKPTATHGGAQEASPQGAVLEDCYQHMLRDTAASAQLDELGVESSEDLRELQEADVIALAACLKKVLASKLLRTLGFNA